MSYEISNSHEYSIDSRIDSHILYKSITPCNIQCASPKRQSTNVSLNTLSQTTPSSSSLTYKSSSIEKIDDVYNYIINPLNGERVHIKSTIGRELLKNYIQALKS